MFVREHSGGEGISARDQNSLVERILASNHFVRSVKLQGFLTYVCAKAMAGRPNEISEQQIGHLVFGREAGYNPSDDNIVRVQARDLRRRLAAYFAEEGADEPVVIEIPKGGYVPHFLPRSQAGLMEAGRLAPVPVTRHEGWPKWISLALGVLCLCLIVAVGWLSTRTTAVPAEQSSVARQFWSRLFRPGHQTVIAVADSSFALLQDIDRVSVPFQDYANGRYFSGLRARAPVSEKDKLLAEVASRHHTSLADASMAARLTQMMPPQGAAVVRFARDLRAEDLKTQDVILLGSERANPWVNLIESWRGLRFSYDPALHRAVVINKRPAAGEPPSFVGEAVGEKPYNSFGTVTFLPNLDRTGSILLIAGTNMQGTSAAGEYLANPDRFEELMKLLKVPQNGRVPYFELVVKLVAVEGTSVSTQPVLHRIVDEKSLQSMGYTGR
ncbi:MAG TPA: hypothetical protein VGK29_07695 [Paludibaculum sp.]|jgi:hypothetical protein